MSVGEWKRARTPPPPLPPDPVEAVARPSRRRQQEHGDRHAPHPRLRSDERQHGEGGDPGDAAQDVDPICLKGLEPREQPTDRLGDQRHRHDDADEHQRQQDPVRERRCTEQADEPSPLGRSVPFHREPEDRSRQPGDRDRDPSRAVAGRVGSQEPHPDPQEAREQDEVREVGHVDDVRRDPTDQRQFDEQHREAGEEQPPRGISHVAGAYTTAPWHFLYFFPEPHGHGALRGTLSLITCCGLLP